MLLSPGAHTVMAPAPSPMIRLQRPLLRSSPSLRGPPARSARGRLVKPSFGVQPLRVAASVTAAKPDQLWEQLKRDADKAFTSASELVERAEKAEATASASRSSWEAAQQKAAGAAAEADQASSEAQKGLERVSDALAGALAGQRTVTLEALHSLAESRLDRWHSAHPGAAQVQKVDQTEAEASNLQGAHVTAHIASASLQSQGFAVVSIAVAATSGGADLEGLLLHWACVPGEGQEWQQPPAGWHTDPAYSSGAGKAWQTPLGQYAPKQDAESSTAGSAWAVVLQLPLAGFLSNSGGVHFVLKRAQGSQPEWLKGPANKDFFLDLSRAIDALQKGKELQGSSTAAQPNSAQPKAAPKTSTAGLDRNAKKALWDQRKAQRKQGQDNDLASASVSSAPIGTSEDWVVLDSGKSFAWSAKQHGSAREQLEALRNIIQKQQQQGDAQAATSLATASTALEAAEPLVLRAEEAHKVAQAADTKAEAKEASRAEDEMKSLQAEAEVAIRMARRAACRLKGKQQEIPVSDLQHVAEEEQRAWYAAKDSRELVAGVQPQTTSFRIQSIDGSLVSRSTVCLEGSTHYAVVSIACGEAFDDGALDETSLHWAVAPGQGKPWEGPPPGWHTEPDSSEDAGGGAYQTLMKRVKAPGYPSRGDIAAHVVTIQVPLEGSLQTGGIAFVLKTGQQQWLASRAAGVLRSDFFISTEEAAIDLEETFSAVSSASTGNGSSGGNGSTRHIAEATKTAAAQGQSAVKEEPEQKVATSSSEDRFSKQGGLGTNKWPGSPVSRIIEDISKIEVNAERSLMHRFNLAKDLVNTATAAGQEADEAEGALTAVLVWLRFSSSRLLTWNRNYNIKPREISTAQDGLTSLLAQLIELHPEWRDLLRLGLAAVGRGGQGDVGQRIRDEILYVQSRNGAKGGMMEEWHQKLHNNTSPDDVVICQALIAYLQSGLDISVYWSTLRAANITQERLASFDRPIRSEPAFKPEQQAGLLTDLTNYLQTLKAVHSGADLQSAAAAVMGYEQVSLKGKAISVSPVPGIATSTLQSLLDAVLAPEDDVQIPVQYDSKTGATHALDAVHKLLEVRTHLLPALAGGNKVCGGRFRDILYLDLALDTAVRAAVEPVLSQLHQPEPEQALWQHASLVLDLVAACTENACLSTSSNAELVMVAKELEIVRTLADARHKWLRAHAACERLSRFLGTTSERYSQAMQPTATALGAALRLPNEATSIFAEEVVRGTAAAPLAQLLAVLDPCVRDLAGLPSWQVISPGTGSATGCLHEVQSLADWQPKNNDTPNILLVGKLGGDEDIPQGVVGVVTHHTPDVLCHAAVRARNGQVLLAACHKEEELGHVKQLCGQYVAVQLTQGNTHVHIAPADPPHEAALKLMPDQAAASHSGPEIVPRKGCGHWAVPSDSFSPQTVGAKSLNTHKLKDQLPTWVQLPCSAALPFGAFEAVVGLPENASTAHALQGLSKQATPSRQQLGAARQAVLGLQAPPQLQEDVTQALQQSGIQWDGLHPSWPDIWRCIKTVWASKWNARAVSSMSKAGLKHADLQMAVLCQPVVPAKYAFVAHTTHPVTGDTGQVYLEIVQGLGETLVGNFPGQALQATVHKSALAGALSNCSGLGTDVAMPSSVLQAVQVTAYPSKSVALTVASRGKDNSQTSVLILRSDSNGEDLEGYAGAGLFDSVQTQAPTELVTDVSSDRLINDSVYQGRLVAVIAGVCARVEQVMGSPQDIEGLVDSTDTLHIVQTRPQV